MKELWIGVVEVLTDPSSGDGDTHAFTNVVTWATSVSSFVATVATVFTEYGWSICGTENVRPVDFDAEFSEEIGEIIERAKSNPKTCIFATFYYYPSKPM